MLASRKPRWPAVETIWARDLRWAPANRPRPPVHTYHSDGVMRFDGNYGAGQLRAQQLRQLCIQRGLNRSQLVRKSF